MQSLLHLHQLLAQSLPRRRSRDVLACVHVFVLWGGQKTATDRCFVYQCRQVYTRGKMLSTLWNILVTILTSPRGIHMHSCMCIMFICTVQALYYMRVYHSVSQHLHVCLGGDWMWFFLSMSIVGACCWRGGLCFSRGRDRGYVLFISLFLRVLRC